MKTIIRSGSAMMWAIDVSSNWCDRTGCHVSAQLAWCFAYCAFIWSLFSTNHFSSNGRVYIPLMEKWSIRSFVKLEVTGLMPTEWNYQLQWLSLANKLAGDSYWRVSLMSPSNSRCTLEGAFLKSQDNFDYYFVEIKI